MSVIGSNILAGSAGQGGGYTIERSLRFRSSASAYLNRTPATAGNRQKFTVSTWYKAGGISAGFVNANIINAGGDGSSLLIAGTGAFGATHNDRLMFREAGATLFYWPMVFRDPSAWYHIVFAMDTTQATASNRAKLYVNGVDQGAFSGTAITQNTSTSINNTSAHYINLFNSSYYHSDLYYAEYNFIDGQALTPSSFGEYNEDTGVWQPAKYIGTYGTNGFYLPFSDNTTTTTLAADSSGNGNNWTPNNISLTSGATYDSMTDTPTPYADGGNYCVWNAVAQSTVVNGTVTRSNANLTSTDGGTTYGLASFGTIAVTTGKWYWEITLTTAGGTYANIGVVDLNSALGAGTHTGIVYSQSGTKSTGSGVFNGGGTSYGASYTAGDVIGVALDLTAGTITFYKNGTSQGIAYTGISGNYTPAVGDAQNSTSYTFDLNCGQRPFAYTPPTGFKALHTGNLPDSAIVDGSEYFNTLLWTGDGTNNRTITGLDFEPTTVWIKNRNGTFDHRLWNDVTPSVRLIPNSTSAESSTFGAFNNTSNGIVVSASVNDNNSSNTYVAWNWKANGAGVSNTDGSITSTVSANPTSGFSICTYTGTGSNATVGHGLGVAPKLIIAKSRTGARGWPVYSSTLGIGQYLELNTTIAAGSIANYWGANSPTSTVFSLPNANYNNNVSGENYVAYCFADVEGYSKFGKYTGNGSSDGPFVYTGFRPAFVLSKRIDISNRNWEILDTSRNPYNAAEKRLFANISNSEDTNVNPVLDFLSNGFKMRTASVNESGGTYIYMAFAETDFAHALAR